MQEKFSVKVDKSKNKLVLKSSSCFETAFLVQSKGTFLPLKQRKKNESHRYEIDLKKLVPTQHYKMVGESKGKNFESPPFFISLNDQLHFPAPSRAPLSEILSLIDRIADRSHQIHNFQVTQLLKSSCQMQKALRERKASFQRLDLAVRYYEDRGVIGVTQATGEIQYQVTGKMGYQDCLAYLDDLLANLKYKFIK